MVLKDAGSGLRGIWWPINPGLVKGRHAGVQAAGRLENRYRDRRATALTQAHVEVEHRTGFELGQDVRVARLGASMRKQ